MSLELIRTVEHVFDDGSASIIEVKVITFQDDTKGVTMRGEHDNDSLMVNSADHAKSLIRAIKAAGERAGWDFEE